MSRQTKTAGEASLMLAKYEQMNSDLPRETRRQLAVFVLSPKVGLPALEELFERELGQTPDRHRAWFWYNAIRLSGLESSWSEFASRYNSTACFYCAIRWLKRQASPAEWT